MPSRPAEGAGHKAWLMVDEILVNPVGLQAGK